MAKSKLRVRRLTLPSVRDAGFQDTDDLRKDEKEVRRTIREAEHLARVVDLSILAGEGKHPRPHVHDVEPQWRSKFWTLGDEDESLDDEDMTASTLVEKAAATDFTMEQLHQAEDELSSPTSPSMKVSASPSEDSLSRKIVQLWVANR
jgi:hypothetical protein